MLKKFSKVWLVIVMSVATLFLSACVRFDVPELGIEQGRLVPVTEEEWENPFQLGSAQEALLMLGNILQATHHMVSIEQARVEGNLAQFTVSEGHYFYVDLNYEEEFGLDFDEVTFYIEGALDEEFYAFYAMFGESPFATHFSLINPFGEFVPPIVDIAKNEDRTFSGTVTYEVRYAGEHILVWLGREEEMEDFPGFVEDGEGVMTRLIHHSMDF